MDRTAELIIAVERALRAPSVHNTQPWRWRVDDDAVQLYADWSRTSSRRTPTAAISS